jgi:hypothetical protein
MRLTSRPTAVPNGRPKASMLSVMASGRFSDSRIHLLATPSHHAWSATVASCGFRPRSQRRDRDGLSPSSLLNLCGNRYLRLLNFKELLNFSLARSLTQAFLYRICRAPSMTMEVRGGRGPVRGQRGELRRLKWSSSVLYMIGPCICRGARHGRIVRDG